MKSKLITNLHFCLAAASFFLTGCASLVEERKSSHGDFQSYRAFLSPKDVLTIAGRRISTDMPMPQEVEAINLPAKVYPLGFSYGAVTKTSHTADGAEWSSELPWRGKLLTVAKVMALNRA